MQQTVFPQKIYFVSCNQFLLRKQNHRRMPLTTQFEALNKLDLDYRGIDQFVARVAEMDQVLAF
jgi:hypothetical protein